ncbi:MAG TPA: hypothetical protein VIY56_10885 [Vicinamibacterales bacterium]
MAGRRQFLWHCLGLALPASALSSGALLAQSPEDPDDFNGGPFTRWPVYEAPFSAEAVTTVDLAFPDGRRLAQRTTARYFRDGNGRVRVEHLMEGLPAPRSPAERGFQLVVSANPCEPGAGLLDSVTRTVRAIPRGVFAMTTGAATYFPIPLGGSRFLRVERAGNMADRGTGIPPGTIVDDERLDARRVSGLEVVGRRVTLTTAIGQIGNDAPVVVRDEAWYSPDLHLVVSADYSDSRFGTVRYRLTNLRRDEPAHDLFVLPADYERDFSDALADSVLSFTPLAAYAAPTAPRARRP